MLETAPSRVTYVPGLVALALRPLPLMPLELVLQRMAAGIVERHPELLERLGAYRARRIGIDPSDLPFAVLLEPRGESITLKVVRELGHEPTHARISAPLLALIGLVDGTYDGDALLFSRDIMIEGDVEAVLALRNAIDDAEIGMLNEAFAWTGPIAGYLEPAARSLFAILLRVVGNGDIGSQGKTQ